MAINKPRAKRAGPLLAVTHAAVIPGGRHPQEIRRERMKLIDQERFARIQFERDPSEAWAFGLKKIRDRISDLEYELIAPQLNQEVAS